MDDATFQALFRIVAFMNKKRRPADIMASTALVRKWTEVEGARRTKIIHQKIHT